MTDSNATPPGTGNPPFLTDAFPVKFVHPENAALSMRLDPPPASSPWRLQTRRAALRLISGVGAAAIHPAWALPDASAFPAFVETLRPQAERAGVAAALFDTETKGLQPDGAVPNRAAAQPEFETPSWVYVEKAAGPARVARGRRAAAQWASQLSAISTKSGAPADIILAAWGMEADFTAPSQNRDVLGALATLAWLQPSEPTFRSEFVAALLMLQNKMVDRARLRGSWAGAMGMPQFMPSAYLRYAVSYRHAGPADIWTSAPDSLASIANFLVRSGWRTGLPWGFETSLPKTFAWESLRGDFKEWRRIGAQRVDGGRFPDAGAAMLFAPAGADGPCFLVSDNYWVLKKYNNSDSYALSLGRLADAIAGRPNLRRSWPQHAPALVREERVRLQEGLAALQFYQGNADGKIGPATRESVHRFERAIGMQPADGLPTPTVLAAIEHRLASSPTP